MYYKRYYIKILSKILAKFFAKHPELLWNLRSYNHFKHTIDFDNPRNLYEFIAASALKNGNNEMWIKLADKYAVRDYVKETIGEEYLIPLLGKWNSPDEIDFDALPDKFVLKTNNSCTTNIMVKDIKNIVSVVLFFFFLEYLLYLKSYNNLLVMNNYIQYEIKENGISEFKNENYELNLNDDGSYCLIVNRESLLYFEKYKKIKYVGIVE